jgi:hypothetical protein
MGDSQNTSFFKTMQEISTNIDSVDFMSIKPPHIGNLAQVYDGQIIAVSMFARYAEGQGNSTERKMNLLAKGSKGRKNLRFIPGRKYINELGLECGTDTGVETTCNEQKSTAVFMG